MYFPMNTQNSTIHVVVWIYESTQLAFPHEIGSKIEKIDRITTKLVSNKNLGWSYFNGCSVRSDSTMRQMEY